MSLSDWIGAALMIGVILLAAWMPSPQTIRARMSDGSWTFFEPHESRDVGGDLDESMDEPPVVNGSFKGHDEHAYRCRHWPNGMISTHGPTLPACPLCGLGIQDPAKHGDGRCIVR